MLAYLGNVTRREAERICAKHKSVVVTGVYPCGDVEIAVNSENERIINMFIGAFERGKL